VSQRRGIIVAIDGPTASGKSTTAKRVAQALGFMHLNTGAMYRAFAVYAKRKGIHSINPDEIKHWLDEVYLSFNEKGNICLNGEDVAHLISAPDIAQLASELSTLSEVREKLVDRQREIGDGGAVVLEGRDIGTVVFPNAELKIFLVADPDVRAERRLEEMESLGTHMSLNELKIQLAERDKRDRERTLSPLRKAPDAIEVDTTYLTIDQQVQRVVDLAKQRMSELKKTPANVTGTAI